jgi:pre-mRNA-splicing factor ATP-dependent RNA helicase DHX16
MTDKSMVDYILATSKTAKSAAKLHDQLLKVDLPDSDLSRRFTSELFGRIPRKAKPTFNSSVSGTGSGVGGSGLGRSNEKEKVALLKKNAEFKLVLDEFDGEDVRKKKSSSLADSDALKVQKKDKKDREKRLRRREDENGSNDAEDDEGNKVIKRSRRYGKCYLCLTLEILKFELMA